MVAQSGALSQAEANEKYAELERDKAMTRLDMITKTYPIEAERVSGLLRKDLSSFLCTYAKQQRAQSKAMATAMMPVLEVCLVMYLCILQNSPSRSSLYVSMSLCEKKMSLYIYGVFFLLTSPHISSYNLPLSHLISLCVPLTRS